MSKKKRRSPDKRKPDVQILAPVPKPAAETKKEPTRPRKKINSISILISLLIVIIGGTLFFFILRPKYQVKRSDDLNVLLVTLDTTRADRIGCYGYEKAKTPTLDALAANGVKFANTYCQVPLTLPSHCTLLTGTYPIAHHVHNNGFYSLSPDFETLSEILKAQGFKTAAFVSSFTVDSRFGLDQGFDDYDDSFLTDESAKSFQSERTADKTSASFWSWLGQNSQQQFFSWLHYYDPHLPYRPPAPFKEEFADRPYDGEIAFMDYYLGKTIDKLRETNILDKTLIVVVGDHGEALGEKNEIDHGLFIYDDTLKVPLIFYAEKYLPKGLVVNSRVRLIDIMPTILDMLKIQAPPQVQGESLLPQLGGKKKPDLATYVETYMPPEYYGWSELIGLVDGKWKYIQAPKPELYDLAADPKEETNLFRKEGRVVGRMKNTLRSLVDKYTFKAQGGGRKLSLEEQERLAALGYVGGAALQSTSGQPLPDPKDKTGEYSVHVFAKKYEYEGDFAKAEEYYQKILSFSPDVAWNYVYLALICQKMGQVDKGLAVLEEGNKRIPNNLIILARLSLFYMRTLKLPQALDAAQSVLKIDPKYFDALYNSALSLAGMNRWAEALGYFERALEVEPENLSLRLQYAYCLAANGRGGDSQKVYDKLKKDFPRDYRIYEEMAIMYDSSGDLKSAKENMKQAIELNPSFRTYYNYAILLKKSGDLESAIQYLRLYLETTPEGDTPRKIQAQKFLTQWESSLQKK
jgi:arylsulfatase A-like enzyme/Tfp pilus assembly protein PilF